MHDYRGRLSRVRDRFLGPLKQTTPGRNTRAYFFFVFTLIFHVGYVLLMEGRWVLSGEMWAEMATNYYANALSPSYLQRLFAADSGYLPIPQRVIALIPNLFSFPASSIPYFYTGCSILLTSAMVAIFCLPHFRRLIANDFLRFLTCVFVLIIVDFETRTFVNFTYFAIFSAAIVTSLALADSSIELPGWSWLLPPLVAAKPHGLAVLPAMLVTSIISQSRFKKIVSATSFLCLIQVISMILSKRNGVMSYEMVDVGVIPKFIASLGYFVGWLGGYIPGPLLAKQIYSIGPPYILMVGLLILLGLLCSAAAWRGPENSLIAVGLSILLGNAFINCFILSGSWSLDLYYLSFFPLYRHTIPGFFGCVLICIGIFSMADRLFFKQFMGPLKTITAPALFLAWTFFSGWFSRGILTSKVPRSPVTNNSSWQRLSKSIDAGLEPLCVPLDPLGWVYGRNCSILNADLNSSRDFFYTQPLPGGLASNLDVKPPGFMKGKTLVSLGILIKPGNVQECEITGHGIITTAHGKVDHVFGSKWVVPTGGLLLLTGPAGISIKDIRSIEIVFNLPVEIAYVGNQENRRTPAILWMGY